MASQFGHALKRDMALAEPLVARQTDVNTICIQNCLYSAVPSAITACNLDLPCMCGNSAFRASVNSCMSSLCGLSGDAYETSLNQIFDECVAGAFGGNLTDVNGIPSVTTPIGTSTRASGHSSATGSSSSSSSDADKGGVSTGAIVGGVVGGIVVLGLVGILVWFLVRRNKRKAQLNNTPHYYPQNGTSSEAKLSPQQQQQFGGAVPQEPPKPFSPPFLDAQGQQPINNNFGGQYAVTPSGDLGYVPPSAFTQYGNVAAAGMGAAALAPQLSGSQRPPSQAGTTTTSSTAPMLTTTATAPQGQSGYGYATSNSGSGPHGYATSNSGSSDSGAGAGIGGFNPYVLQGQPPQQPQQQRPLQLHTAPPDVYGAGSSSSKPDYAQQGGGGQWMSAQDEKKRLNVMSAEQQAPQEEAPPPVYRQ